MRREPGPWNQVQPYKRKGEGEWPEGEKWNVSTKVKVEGEKPHIANSGVRYF